MQVSSFSNFRRSTLPEHFLANETSDVLMVDFRVMLQRNNHGGHGDGHVILIGNSDLRLTVRAQPRGWRVFSSSSLLQMRCASTTGRGRYSSVSLVA